MIICQYKASIHLNPHHVPENPVTLHLLEVPLQPWKGTLDWWLVLGTVGLYGVGMCGMIQGITTIDYSPAMDPKCGIGRIGIIAIAFLSRFL
jgi:hypothetical protein